MRLNNRQQDPIKLEDDNLQDVDKFIYLGSVVYKDGGADKDIRSRISKARYAFISLRPIWNSAPLSLRSKLRMFNTNVKSVLLHGSEIWRTTKTNTHKQQTFFNRCPRTINIRWLDVISNIDLWEQATQSPIDIEIRKRK